MMDGDADCVAITMIRSCTVSLSRARGCGTMAMSTCGSAAAIAVTTCSLIAAMSSSERIRLTADVEIDEDLARRLKVRPQLA